MSVMSALRECHRLRVHLRNLQAEIDLGPRTMQEYQDDLHTAQQTHKHHYDEITKLKLKQREDEVTLKQTEARLAKLEDQLTGISVQKEYAAKESEIAQAKAKKGELEDAILTTIVQLEELNTAIPAVEQAWKAAQAEFAQLKAEAEERLVGMQNDQIDCTTELARVESTLPPEIKSTYDTIVKAKGPDALTGAKNRVCQACRTSMTEMQFLMLKNDTFRTCTNCGRIQYAVE